MEREFVSRLWHLAKIQTHSPGSLKELQELVRVAIIRSIANEDYPHNNLCDYCAKQKGCERAYATYVYCEQKGNFEVKEENGQTAKSSALSAEGLHRQ